jgi:hypothetical protein
LRKFIEQIPQVDSAVSERLHAAGVLQVLGQQSSKLFQAFGVPSRQVIMESAAQVPREQSAKRQHGRENHAQ